MKYIYSTKTAPTTFVLYKKGGGDMPVNAGSVTIAGGAGVSNKNFVTPLGVVTKVEDEDFKLLEQNKIFQRQVKAGWLSVENKKIDEEKAAADMASRDNSAPIVTEDLEAEGLEVDSEGKETTVTPSTKGKKGK